MCWVRQISPVCQTPGWQHQPLPQLQRPSSKHRKHPKRHSCKGALPLQGGSRPSQVRIFRWRGVPNSNESVPRNSLASYHGSGLIRELLLKRHRLYYTIQPMEERTIDENDVPGVSVLQQSQMTCTSKSVYFYITTDIELVRVTCRSGYARLRA